ncbi:LTA synthase family protein [Undibacterium sp.]|uniref:LTA synthase family protein n=1 Tax=Undibacterium sp. TaxID=1914977 RepID=UPI0025CD34EE|nr:LTA synthase family protein [Undibacterium sp.]
MTQTSTASPFRTATLGPLQKLILAQRQNIYVRLALIALLCLLPFLVARVALYLFYFEHFRNLNLQQVAMAFWVGLRFDLSVITFSMFLPSVFLLLPFRWAQHPVWQRLWCWIIYLGLLLLVVLLIGDAVYFGEVGRHVGSEISTVRADLAPMLTLALHQYSGLLALFAAFSVLGAWVWHRVVHPVVPVIKDRSLRLIGLLLVLALCVVSGRGGWTNKPISVSDAFFSNSSAQAYLTLNGAFAVSHALADNTPPVHDFMPQPEAIARTQKSLAGQHPVFQDLAYPLYRQLNMAANASAGTSAKPPNVVVLVLESWGAQHIDAIRAHLELPPIGATPHFDALAKQGRLYTRFFANGQRSIVAAQSILASLPTLPGMLFLGEGIEQNRQSFMGEMAQAQNYQTIFLQSDHRVSFRFNSISARAGFATYLGAEDMPELHPKPKPDLVWGTWDHNTLQQANRLFAQAQQTQQPFLGYIFTSTTHAPFMVPEQRWRKYPETSELNKFLNSMYYADWAIAEMMAAAKQAGYYDNTIFIITGDHVSGVGDYKQHVPNLYHIPLLIVGPGITPGVDDRIGSHVDILPTIAELAHWSTGYAGIGRSLLDPERIEERVALSVRGEVIDLISNRGWISHNLNRTVGNSADLSDSVKSELEQLLLAHYQSISHLMLENRIQPAAKH